MKKQHIKLFSHNDLDGFGAPLLLKTVAPWMFESTSFDLKTCSAGRLDEVLGKWFNSGEASAYDAVYIMDMTPDSEYTFQQLENTFANHWLVFDHHESEAGLRTKYSANCISPADESKTPAATSLVWDWLTAQPQFSRLPEDRKQDLGQLAELIRAYDTWDFQNDPLMSPEEKEAADELNQLFWFYPLSQSETFVSTVFATGWDKYAAANNLLIETLNQRRARYLKRHMQSVFECTVDKHRLAIVYASDYKSELAHEVLLEHPVDACLVIDAHSVSLRSNGKLDVASFAEQYFNGGGHADSAGGTLPTNPLLAGAKTVATYLEDQQALAAREDQAEPQNALADALDPEVAAKMAALFGKDGD